MFNTKDFGGLLISQGRALNAIRYPIFCEIIDGMYDTDKDVMFDKVVRTLLLFQDKQFAVLDSFDLSYQGYIDFKDIATYLGG